MVKLLKTNNINKKPEFWWNISHNDLITSLSFNISRGLSIDQVNNYRRLFGSNILKEIKPTSIWELIFDGIKEPMMILLLSIAGLSLLFGEPVEAIVMIFVVIAYITVEFINKFRSDRTMARLRALTQPMTKVLRDGYIQEIQTSDVVVGDIVILSEGVRVPADIRLIESFGLFVNEAPLTGESLPIQKDAQSIVQKETTLAERRNCLFSGTMILAGEGKGIVMAVGNQSELGKIANQLQIQRKEKTFIQGAMTRLTKVLAIFAIIVSIIIPLIGFFRGLSMQDMILTWLALTFLMIPGQPPIIITMSLALASFALVHEKFAVKRLRGVETLGQITTIITDKTGTITENKMKVDIFVLPDGRSIKPQVLNDELKYRISLCLPRYSTDPTDIAISESLGLIENEEPYKFMQSFTEDHPWRILIYGKEKSTYYAIAGQPESLINFSNINAQNKENLLDILQKETHKRNRVIAYAFKESVEDKEVSPEGSQFLALAVLSDPVRFGVKDAVESLSQADISTYVVTGDHPITAEMVAKEIGIDSITLSGNDLDKLEDQNFSEKISSTKIFARITPLQKQHLVSVLKQRGEIVAVIGDGVNDAPALKAADVGIAMGEIGTDLARETADLVLTDDNFVHLPKAILLGRKALDNFRKGLTYYLSAKTILLFIFLVPLVLGIPFPFAPIHIILTELLMDLASSTIFVTEVAEPDILKRGPQRINTFLNKSIILHILKNSIFLTLGILTIYLWLYYSTYDIILAQTAAFVTWLLGHIMLALNLKQEKLPLLKQGIFSNRFGFFWLVGMIVFSLFITTIPNIRPYLHTTPLPLHVWLIIIAIVLGSTWWIEILKFVRDRFARKGI